MKLSMKLLTLLILGIRQSLAAPKAITGTGTCLTKDYIKCALVFPSCGSTCSESSESVSIITHIYYNLKSEKYFVKAILYQFVYTLSAVCLYFRIGY